MKKLLYIIVDISGSMNEMGKIHLQRNLCRFASQLKNIDQVKYSDIDIHFFQWNETISEFFLQKNGDIPPLTPVGSSDLYSLSKFLSKSLSNNNDLLKIIILSDGNFISSAISDFKRQMNIFKKMILKTVAIGADANLLYLKKISTNNNVYLSENISSAIDSIIFGTTEQIFDQESANQINLIQSSEKLEECDV